MPNRVAGFGAVDDFAKQGFRQTKRRQYQKNTGVKSVEDLEPGISILNRFDPAAGRASVTDEDLPGITHMSLSETKVTDDGVASLKGLTKLEGLLLRGKMVTDKGLENLKNLTNLRQLWLERTSITDDGLAHLAGLSKLQDLRLGSTKITNVGLTHLKKLEGLQKLQLTNTKVKDAGVNDLQKALGPCKIER